MVRLLLSRIGLIDCTPARYSVVLSHELHVCRRFTVAKKHSGDGSGGAIKNTLSQSKLLLLPLLVDDATACMLFSVHELHPHLLFLFHL